MSTFPLSDFLNLVNLSVALRVLSDKEGLISDLNFLELCTSVAFFCDISCLKHAVLGLINFAAGTSHRLPGVVVSLIYLVLSCLLLGNFLTVELHAFHEGIEGEEAEEERQRDLNVQSWEDLKDIAANLRA